MKKEKPEKKNFWHYMEINEDPEAKKLMPLFEIRYVINEDTVPNNNSMVWNHGYFPPGGIHHKHYHKNADEVAYLIKGRCIAGVTIDGKDVEQVISPGTAVWASKGQAHWHRNPFNEPCEFVGVYCGCSSLEKSGYVDLRTDDEKKKR